MAGSIALSLDTELAVIGGGPAGLCAAVEAARHGVEVVLLDENHVPGGQLIKQIHRFFGSKEHLAGVRGIDIAAKLLAEAEDRKVAVWLNTVAWGLFADRQIGILRDDRVSAIRAERIIVATGASENSLRFPGWTLPNVMGAGAAQTMVNTHRVLPGRRVLVVGSGNVGLIVAYQLLQAGAEVVAVVETLPTVTGYQVHASKIVRMGIPILTRHTIVSARGGEHVESTVIAEVDERHQPIPGTEREVPIDMICIAVGLRPLAELCWMAGMAFDYQRDIGGFVPVHDEGMETSQRGIYIAGDLAGIEEASTAMEEGRLAALSASVALGKIDSEIGRGLVAETNRRLSQLRIGPYGEYRHQAKQAIMAKFREARAT
jgi:thioredoxin reductase